MVPSRGIISANQSHLIAIFNYQAEILICGATAEKEYTDWQELHRESGPWDGEPLFDINRWREDGILSVYVQRAPNVGGEPTDLYIVDFDVSATGKNK